MLRSIEELEVLQRRTQFGEVIDLSVILNFCTVFGLIRIFLCGNRSLSHAISSGDPVGFTRELLLASGHICNAEGIVEDSISFQALSSTSRKASTS